MRRQRVLGAHDSRAPIQRRRHGLTAAEIGALFESQRGLCAICGRASLRLQVDHDHRHCAGSTGCRLCVRGALCGRCNTALGRFGDHLIPQVIAYLSR